MNKPVSRSVDILLPDGNGAVEWSAKLREDIVEGDPDSVFRDEVPTFHGLSVSGNVTGKILFAGESEAYSRLRSAVDTRVRNQVMGASKTSKP
jgi:N-acetylated-alpha-linked acidic dipeptidase